MSWHCLGQIFQASNLISLWKEDGDMWTFYIITLENLIIKYQHDTFLGLGFLLCTKRLDKKDRIPHMLAYDPFYIAFFPVLVFWIHPSPSQDSPWQNSGKIYKHKNPKSLLLSHWLISSGFNPTLLSSFLCHFLMLPLTVTLLYNNSYSPLVQTICIYSISQPSTLNQR